ncbi:uncharacterized protein LOC126210242 isoform X2 [Schistocerca nitens]|uniref:uncharacterized protein LOC126210242 isoform X2 n=1 Tax=Schistocerca nitens TaxID=7011 RepID=UPI002118976B|nr:uncharacterized protein LOC126210242 isoform X2 [Schistocerca nitens]
MVGDLEDRVQMVMHRIPVAKKKERKFAWDEIIKLSYQNASHCRNVDQNSVLTVRYWFGPRPTRSPTTSWTSIFPSLRRSMATMENKLWECCFGTSMTLSEPSLIWQISHRFQMNGQWRTKCSLSRPFSFTERVSTASGRCCPTRQLRASSATIIPGRRLAVVPASWIGRLASWQHTERRAVRGARSWAPTLTQTLTIRNGQSTGGSVERVDRPHVLRMQRMALRRTGSVRPTTGPVKRDRHMHSLLRHKRKPPRGMYINHDDLVAMASSQGGGAGAGGEHMLKAMDREIVSLKRQVQNNKQTLSALRRKTSEGIDEYRPLDSNTRINARWTNDELLLAVQGVRKYGKDFRAIAEVLGTKTEAHVRSYFVNYRRRYNLDAVLKEFEAENGPIVDAEADKDEKMETDGVSSGSEASTPTPGGSSPVTVTSSAAGGSAGTAAVVGSTGAGSGPVASPGKNSSGFPKTPPVGPGQAAK